VLVNNVSSPASSESKPTSSAATTSELYPNRCARLCRSRSPRARHRQRARRCSKAWRRYSTASRRRIWCPRASTGTGRAAAAACSASPDITDWRGTRESGTDAGCAVSVAEYVIGGQFDLSACARLQQHPGIILATSSLLTAYLPNDPSPARFRAVLLPRCTGRRSHRPSAGVFPPATAESSGRRRQQHLAEIVPAAGGGRSRDDHVTTSTITSWHAYAIRPALEGALLNVALNARDAMQKVGRMAQKKKTNKK